MRARIRERQGSPPEAIASHRGPGARDRTDGRGRSLLHRRADAGLGGDQGAAERRPGHVRRSPASLRGRRRRQGRQRGRGQAHRGDRRGGATAEELTRRRATATTTATYTVTGMTCDHCVRAVTTEVQKIAGVTAVDVELDSGRVTVTSDAPVDEQAVRAAVDEAGYEVS